MSLTKLVQLVSSRRRVPREVLEAVTEHAEQLGLRPEDATELRDEEIMYVLLAAMEGELKHEISKKDGIRIIHIWDPETNADAIIAHSGTLVLGWRWD